MAQPQHRPDDDKPLWLPGMYKRVPPERRRTLRRIQEMVAKYNPEGRSLVDELLEERRAEAERG